MNVVHERCCGLDVHKATVVACRLTPGRKEVRTFPTTTRGLLVLADWLADHYSASLVALSTLFCFPGSFHLSFLSSLINTIPLSSGRTLYPLGNTRYPIGKT